MAISKLRQELIDRYNATWDDAHIIDNTGIIKACKDNFEELINLLIEEVSIKSLEINRL